MAVTETKSVDLSGAMLTESVAIADYLVVLPVVLLVLTGGILMMIRKNTALHARLAVAALAVLVIVDAALLYHVLQNGTVSMTMGSWLPPFGIAFTADALGAAFAMAAGIVGLAAGIFAATDIGSTERRYGFYPFLLLMIAGVTGAFLTGDIFNLYVWFEVLLISSFGLLILGSHPQQIDGATKYAFLNLVATTLFLIATGYLYGVTGTLNFADLVAKFPLYRDTAPAMTLALLFFLAFGMKAAAFPVNFWLPASYHTPRLVVSAVFAGVLTKVGIYALMRVMFFVFPEQRDVAAGFIAVIAILTMLSAAFGALAQTDIRRLMNYLVISGIGMVMAGIALGSQPALSGAIFYALHSIIVMTVLYLVAGIAARIGGGYSIDTLSGLYARAPLFAFTSLVLFFAVSGLPPLSGFWPKLMLVKASLDVGAWFLAATILMTGFLTTIAVGRVFALAYWRNSEADLPPRASETLGVRWMLYGPLVVLTAIVILAGLFPDPVMRLANVAADGLLDPSSYVNSVFGSGATQ